MEKSPSPQIVCVCVYIFTANICTISRRFTFTRITPTLYHMRLDTLFQNFPFSSNIELLQEREKKLVKIVFFFPLIFFFFVNGYVQICSVAGIVFFFFSFYFSSHLSLYIYRCPHRSTDDRASSGVFFFVISLRIYFII